MLSVDPEAVDNDRKRAVLCVLTEISFLIKSNFLTENKRV
jgi:hypothetical protein